MTNGDSIRAMVNEDLAAVVMCPNESGAEIPCDKSDDCDCYACILAWLGKEAKTDVDA